MHVLSDVLYNRTKSQRGMFCIMGYIKMTKALSWLCLLVYSPTNICHFCVAQTPKYFALKICTVIVYIINNVYDFFQIFLKHLNIFFEFFKIIGSLQFGSTKSPLTSIFLLDRCRMILSRTLLLQKKQILAIVGKNLAFF